MGIVMAIALMRGFARGSANLYENPTLWRISSNCRRFLSVGGKVSQAKGLSCWQAMDYDRRMSGRDLNG
jgi:hypothetical protein